MTAAKLGETVGVSESTVVRFASGLGYEGYPEFQKALEDFCRLNFTAYVALVAVNNIIHAFPEPLRRQKHKLEYFFVFSGKFNISLSKINERSHRKKRINYKGSNFSGGV